MTLDRGAWRRAYALPDRAVPRVRAAMIASADGAATFGGRSGTLGGEDDRMLLHALRAFADVVLVGAGTVRVEGYGGLGLEPADRDWRHAQGLSDAPRVAVVSEALDLEPEHPVFAQADVRPIVITHAGSDAARRAALAEVAEVVVCGQASVDLAAALAALAGLGMPQVLCEGGPRLLGSLLAGGLVDELSLTIAPRLAGGAAPRIVAGAPEADRPLRLAACLAEDDFVFLRYTR